MVYILAGPGDEGPLGTQRFSDRAAPQRSCDRGCRGRNPDFPERPSERGATAVAYSGGKCIRGPQAAGLLLGEKNLCRRPGSTALRTMPSAAR